MAIKSTNQITIVDVTDAYSVMLTSEAYTFVGSTSGAGSGLACTTQAVAFCGSNQCSSVNVTASAITCPTGISATVANSGTATPTITFTTTGTIANACEAIIPIVVDGITINKKFSFAVAKAGAAGKGVNGITTYYQKSSSTTAPALYSSGTTIASGWSTTPPSTDTTNKYLWSFQRIDYTTGSDVDTTPAIISTHGATGSAGKGISSITVYYCKSPSTTAPALYSSGTTVNTNTWSTTPPSTDTSNKYLWSFQRIAYTTGSPVDTKPAIISTHGATGAAGADAITLTITSSNGTVFKNNSGSTVLTAHVFKGGIEQSITDAGVVANSLGTIKWYKGAVTSSSTAVATAKTLTVNATAVTNTETYTAQLE